MVVSSTSANSPPPASILKASSSTPSLPAMAGSGSISNTEHGGNDGDNGVASRVSIPAVTLDDSALVASAHAPHHCTVIPSYPYNVSSTPYFPGSSSDRSERVFEQHAPDDSNVQTRLPSIAVDYLSHDWKEDDVWASWKAMTKHKSELANGVRLENASWRTWAKKRGKLKTISPETLNWLKDSDVTWLYGPLHTAVDPVPPPRKSTTEDRLGLTAATPVAKKNQKTSSRSYSTSSSTASGQHGVPLHVKPILKHRSLSDILSVPTSGAASPVSENMYGGNSEEEDDNGDLPSVASSDESPHNNGSRKERSTSPSTAPRRPGVLRTSSHDSTGSRKSNVHPHGFDSQSLDNEAAGLPDYPPAPHDLPSGTRSSFRRISSNDHMHPRKRHIVFNHRVEQCISLDVDDDRTNSSGSSSSSRGGKQPYSNALQRYGSHSQASSSSSSSASSSSDDDDDDDDEQVLTFRSSSPKSPSFVKPFLPSPDGVNSPNAAAGSAGGKKVPYGTLGPHGQEPQQPHTIAPLEPTTLKESELMPGPTPIVVYQDGKITALYGALEDYVYDAEEHGGIPDWTVPRSAAELGGTAIEDDDEDDADAAAHVLDPASRKAKTEEDEEDDGHYDPVPASSARVNTIHRDTVMPSIAQSMIQNDPVSSSVRYADADSTYIASASGQPKETSLAATEGTGFFAGPESAMSDDYDARQVTASQAKFGSTAPYTSPQQQRLVSQSLSASSSNSSSEITLSGSSPSTAAAMLYSTSPSGSKGPTKSILKKGRDPSQPGSADYYPPVPPAVTRASRAHAQMFDENGDEVVSPSRPPIRLPETETLAQDGTTSPTLTFDASPNQGLYGASQVSGSYGMATPAIGEEPVRGRSISRGNSSSSLYERAQTAAAAEYRSRSQSGGSSISPVASYSPPFTASLNSLGSSMNSLGIGTALMQSQPADIPRGRNVQTARPSSRREALSDTSSDEGSSTEEERDDEEGQAANMDFSEDAQADSTSRPDTVHFTRQHGQSLPGTTLKQSHNATLNDDDDAEVEQVSSPDSMRGTLDQTGFDSRPANAATAGREKASPSSLEHQQQDKERQANAAKPINGKNNNTTSPVRGDKSARRHRQTGKASAAMASITNTLLSDADEDMKTDAEGASDLFDSPYMPSSPRIASSTNLPGLPGISGSSKNDPDSYILSWADKDDKRRSKAEGSLLQSLAGGSSRPSWLGRRKGQRSISDGHAHATLSEDEMSDPANNGYSYGYGFDEEEEDRKSYVGQATDLLGALWNVGTSMIWRGDTTSSPLSSKPSTPTSPDRTPKSKRK